MVKALHMVAFTLVIVGALNWGLVGLLGESGNLVRSLMSFSPELERLVYILVGLSAVWLVVNHKKDCLICSKM